MAETGNLILRTYGNFRGVDFRGEEINIVRSPDCLNVWKDYKHTDSIRTRPGMELLNNNKLTAPINAMCSYGQWVFVHSGDSIYSTEAGFEEFTEMASGVGTENGNFFVYNNILYFINGYRYLCFDERWSPEDDNYGFSDVEGYIPTTSIARKPEGGGKEYEDVNLLTSLRRNTFLSDGVSTVYKLDTDGLDSSYPVRCGVINGDTPSYTVDYGSGTITFSEPPISHSTDGKDNVEVIFKTIDEHRNDIERCTIVQIFDNRVFLSGNEYDPCKIWHSSIDDPTYFSDLDYYYDGHDASPIKSMAVGNNALWVFKEPYGDNSANVYYHVPTIDAEYGKIYPSQHSSIDTGCFGKAINFNDDIVFFSLRGMEGVSGDIATEQFLAHRSSLVDRKLTEGLEKFEKEFDDYYSMVLAEWEGYLLVFVGNRVFLADSRAILTNENHTEYEWFYWELDKRVTCATMIYGVLHLGTEDGGIYTLTDMKNESGIESYWTTPKDKFKAPHKLKTTNKRGCVVEAEGDISVYVKTEKTEFEHIGTYKDIEDYFVSRIKRKKFKDIQLKFHSNTRFSLETATLECFVGGYIKR